MVDPGLVDDLLQDVAQAGGEDEDGDVVLLQAVEELLVAFPETQHTHRSVTEESVCPSSCSVSSQFPPTVPERSVRLPHHLWELVLLYPLLHQQRVGLEVPAEKRPNTSSSSHHHKSATFNVEFGPFGFGACDSPLHHERVLLLHGEVGVDLDGVVRVLQVQQLLPALLRHQLTVVDDVCSEAKQVSVRTERHIKTFNS